MPKNFEILDVLSAFDVTRSKEAKKKKTNKYSKDFKNLLNSTITLVGQTSWETI